MATQGPTVLRGTSHPRWFAPVGAALFLIGLVGGFVGYDATRSEPTKTNTMSIGFGTFAAAVLAIGAMAVLTRRELTVDGDGIEVRQRKPLRIQWSEEHDFYYRGITGSGMPVVENVSVRTPDGRSIDVDNISASGNATIKVPKVVEQYSTAANWPKIQTRLQAGEEVVFGQVSMTKEQIKIGTVTQSLERRVTLQIEQGKIKVGAGGKWQMSEVSVNDIANYPCLLKAIGQVAQALPPG